MNRKVVQNQEKDKQEALATLGMYALEKNDLQAIMSRAIDLSCIVLDLDCAIIFTLNKDGDHNTISIGAQAGCAEVKEPITAKEKWDIGYALANEDPIIVTSYEEDDRFSISPFLQDDGVKSSVTIVVKGINNKYGLLGFYTYTMRQFTDHEINFMQIVANMIGMAIERKENRRDLKEKNRRLHNEMERSRQFQRDILNNNIAERWEIGSYLHDNFAQMLASAKIMIDDIDKKVHSDNVTVNGELTKLRKIIDDGINGIRNLTHDIIPVDIEEEGVEYAFSYLVRQSEKLYDVNCELNGNGALAKIKNRKMATHIYHVVQEAIKNAIVHGEADNIQVTFNGGDDSLEVIIQDDGKGVADDLDNDGKGKGLRIMHHRIELLGGTFKIEDSPSDQSGTIVSCTIPFEYLLVE